MVLKEFAYIHDEGHIPDTLKQVPFLDSFTSEHLDDVLHSSSIVECDEGDVVIEEGNTEARIYILLAGELDVMKGEEKIAGFSKTGEIFGELAVVNEEARTASVVARSKTFCLAVDQQFLQDIKPKEENASFYAALYEFIARITAGRLKETSMEVVKLDKRIQDLEQELEALKGK